MDQRTPGSDFPRLARYSVGTTARYLLDLSQKNTDIPRTIPTMTPMWMAVVAMRKALVENQRCLEDRVGESGDTDN